MSWVAAILIAFGLLCCWLLTSPVILEIDSRKPIVNVRWMGIGSVAIFFDETWQLAFRIFFYRKKIALACRAKKSTRQQKRQQKKNFTALPGRMLRIIKTFTIQQCELAVDTGDVTWNARLYPLNFLPGSRSFVRVNFFDQNYCCLRLRNRPWKLLIAFLR